MDKENLIASLTVTFSVTEFFAAQKENRYSFPQKLTAKHKPAGRNPSQHEITEYNGKLICFFGRTSEFSILKGMSCPSWQWHKTGSSWFAVRTLPVAPLWCDLGLVPNSRGNKAAANLRPTNFEITLDYFGFGTDNFLTCKFHINSCDAALKCVLRFKLIFIR